MVESSFHNKKENWPILTEINTAVNMDAINWMRISPNKFFHNSQHSFVQQSTEKHELLFYYLCEVPTQESYYKLNTVRIQIYNLCMYIKFGASPIHQS